MTVSHSSHPPSRDCRQARSTAIALPSDAADNVGSTHALRLHRALRARGERLPLAEWREPGRDVVGERVIVGDYQDFVVLRNKVPHDTGAHSNLKRYRLDAWRTRIAEFADLGDYTRNTKEILQTTQRHVAYRVDARTPAQLLASDGFGPSRQVEGIHPMIDAPVLVASASLRGSDRLFKSRIPSISPDDVGSYQYAIDVEGVVTASWAEHFVLTESLAPHAGRDFMLSLDEVHVDAERITADRIYLIGSSDSRTQQWLEARFADDAASDIAMWGVPITDYR